MRIGRILPRTEAEGPGVRFAVWVQGCDLRCPGCYARALWDPAGGEEIAVSDLIGALRREDGLEGITLLGGEPFRQAEELALFARAARETGLSVICFTGRLWEDLRAGSPGERALLAETDLLIDGPYREAERDFSRPLVGSRNQRFCFLSERYAPADILSRPNRMEVRIEKNGLCRINGMGDFPAMERLLRDRGLVKGEESCGFY